jgi:hypothetical protein
VADDGQAQPGAAGLPAARRIDAVEALEDPVVLVVGDADAVVGHHQLDPRALGPSPHLHAGPGLAVLDRVLDEVAERRDELAAITGHAHVGRDLQRSDLDRARLGERTGPVDRFSHDGADVDEIDDRCFPELDAGQLEEVVDRARHAVALVDHATEEPLDDLGIVLDGQGLGEHRQRTHRRLQLVADVGNEVGPHRIEAAAFADVLDRRHRRSVGQRRRADDDGDARRAVELERLRRRPAPAGVTELLLHGLVHEQADVGAGQRA